MRPVFLFFLQKIKVMVLSSGKQSKTIGHHSWYATGSEWKSLPLKLCDCLFLSISVLCCTVNAPLRGDWRLCTSLPKLIPLSIYNIKLGWLWISISLILSNIILTIVCKLMHIFLQRQTDALSFSPHTVTHISKLLTFLNMWITWLRMYCVILGYYQLVKLDCQDPFRPLAFMLIQHHYCENKFCM